VRLPVYILAGGQARRFGADKAAALLAGAPLVVHVARSLTEVASSVTLVVARAAAPTRFGLRQIGDRVPGQGPLGGLQAALDDLPAAAQGWLLLVGCDQLGLERRWIDRLTRAARARDDVAAVAFREPRRWQPLPGLYHRLLLPAVEAALADGDRSLHRLLARAAALALEPPAGWERRRDVNSLEALEEARRARGDEGAGL